MNDGALKIIKNRISISKSMQTARRPSELQTDGALLPTASVGFSSGFANVCDVRIDAIVGHCRKSLFVVCWFALAVSLDDICRLGGFGFWHRLMQLVAFFSFLTHIPVRMVIGLAPSVLVVGTRFPTRTAFGLTHLNAVCSLDLS